MPSPSPICTVNTLSVPVDVTSGATCTIALASTAGANTWFITAIATDETNAAATVNATLVIDSVHKTATFTAPAGLGSAVIFQSTVGVGPSSQQGHGTDANNVEQASFTTTFKVNVKTGSGLRVVGVNETTEGNASGWIAAINAAIRAVAAGSIAIAGSGLVHATGGSLDGTAYKGTAGQALFTNAAGTDTQWAAFSGDVTPVVGTPGKLTVTGLGGIPLPAPSGANTVPVYNGGVITWSTAASGGALTAFGADLAGSTAINQWVASITGPGGTGTTVPLHVPQLQFDTNQTTAILSQATAGVASVPVNLTLSPQPANAGAGSAPTGTPGSLDVALSNPVGTGTYAAFRVLQAGTPFFRIDNGSALTGLTAMWVAGFAAAPTINNIAFAYDSATMDWILPDTGADVGWNNDGSIHLVGGTVSASGPLNSSVYAGISSTTTGTFGVFTNYLGPGVRVFEAGFVGTTGRRVTALNQCALSGITTTQMPTNTGDGVTYIGNAQTVPTASPVGGAILYGHSGALYVYQSDGTNFQIAASGGSGALTGVDVIGADSAHAYVVSLSGSGGGGGAVTLASTAWIQATTNRSIIKTASTFLFATDGSGHTIVNGPSGVYLENSGNPVAQLNSLASDFVALGAGSVATTGNLRLSNATVAVASARAGGGADLAAVATDAFNNVIVGSDTTAGNCLFAGGSVVGINATTRTSLYVSGTEIVRAGPGAVNFALAVGGFATAFQWQTTGYSVTGLVGTVTVPSSTYQCPIIQLTASGVVPAGALVFPNVEAEWIIDLSFCAFGAGHVTFQAGGATKTVTVSHTSPLLMRLLCDGSGNMYSMAYS